ncbi:head fiber protein [Paenibacillus sp. UMB7766-LJ446]|uniref:head fiber protein n=1 Tax=Paenibacillus sp. UMB7766-LJ446 TaxID=3046313 RepID=UPI00254B2EE1|nr:head fiber protein [Paenibacillus sp. UMB7766-LJ446]MDK8193771.1 head fiber protein [Paenibacillus sp. UMB7766-LJ446]
MMPINHTRQPNYQKVIPAAEAPRLPEKREADYVVFVDEDGTPIDLGGSGGGSGPITSDNITDASSTGKSVLKATDAAAARTAIGAGTSNLAIGTTGTTAAAGNHAHAVAAITGLQAALDAKLTGTKAAAQANSTATDVAGLVADFNALLAKLRTAGVIS